LGEWTLDNIAYKYNGKVDLDKWTDDNNGKWEYSMDDLKKYTALDLSMTENLAKIMEEDARAELVRHKKETIQTFRDLVKE
jgi:hypothetical protein